MLREVNLSLERIDRAQRFIRRWFVIAPLFAVAVLLFFLGVVRLAQARWFPAAMLAVTALVLAAVAAALNWWFRRQSERPGWARGLPPETMADPTLRVDAWRRSRRAKVQTWVMILIGVAGSVVGVSSQRWDLLVVGAIAVIVGCRLLRDIYKTARRPDDD